MRPGVATRSELEGRIAVLLGGLAAEEMTFGEPSTGSNDDLVRATELARRMVWECGMSDGLGAIAVPGAAGAGDGSAPAWSDATIAAIDAETTGILASAGERARSLVECNCRVLDCLATTLVAAESLEGEALHRILAEVRSVEGVDRRWSDLRPHVVKQRHREGTPRIAR